MTAISFPLGGTPYEMALYFMVSLCWVIPVWLAAPKLGYSRWWTVAVLLSPTALVVLFWILALPESWRPGEEREEA